MQNQTNIGKNKVAKVSKKAPSVAFDSLQRENLNIKNCFYPLTSFLFSNKRHNFLKPPGIGIVEGIKVGTIHIEYAVNMSTFVTQRHHYFGARARIAGNVSGELMHISNHNGLPVDNGFPANAGIFA